MRCDWLEGQGTDAINMVRSIKLADARHGAMQIAEESGHTRGVRGTVERANVVRGSGRGMKK